MPVKFSRYRQSHTMHWSRNTLVGFVANRRCGREVWEILEIVDLEGFWRVCSCEVARTNGSRASGCKIGQVVVHAGW